MSVAGGSRLSSLSGGRRKKDTALAHRVVRVARWTRLVWRRRRNENGHPLRGWEWREEELPLREVALLARCEESYVRSVLKRLFGE
jgi:hypothetical protein